MELLQYDNLSILFDRKPPPSADIQHNLLYDNEVLEDFRLPKICHGVFFLEAWYMAPQGLSHSVSISRAAAHAVPSRERGLSNRWSGKARCRQLSAVRGERAE